MHRAGCYIRVSTEEQAEFSPPSQLREMRDYAKKNNMQILNNHIYIDEGISGRSSDRPAFQRMIAAAKSGERPFDVLLLYKFSRFARNREDSVVYKSILRNKCGIEVISIKEPIDKENKMSIIMEAFIEAMDEYYSLNLSEDVRRTMTEKALKGQYQSSPPLGYVMTQSGLVIQPEESRAVREIYSRYIGGCGCLSIARWLNSSGVRTKRGGSFETRAVEYILQNPVYCGMVRWRKSDGEEILVLGEHAPIIEKEAWEQVQALYKENAGRRKQISAADARGADWLSGMVKCAACGGSIVKAGGYWRCGRYVRGRCYASQHISDKLLKQAVISSMQRDIPLAEDITCHRAGRESGRSSLEAQLHKNAASLERARQAYLAGADSLEDYTAVAARLKRERERIADELKREEQSGPSIKALADIFLSKDISCEAKSGVIRSVIDCMVLDKGSGSLKIYYK